MYRPFLADPDPAKMPILGDLYDELLRQPEPEAARIAAALELYVSGSLNVFNHRTNVELSNRLVCFDIKQLGKQLKKLGMLIVQDQTWNRVTINRAEKKATRYYMDEFHLLLKEEQTAAYSVEIWKRFRKWGGIPTAITQNVKDLLASREVENIFENSDFVLMLNQAQGDRTILAKQLNISPQQMKYVTHTEAGEGLIFYGNAYYAADYVKAIAPLTGEKPTELQRAHIRQQKVAAQEQPAQEQPEQEAPQDKDTFSIYQIKGGDETRDLRFEPYDRLIAAGHRVDPKNYALVYSAPLTPGTSLEDIYTRFNIDHPKDFKGHSLSVSDVVVLHQNGQDTAHYVDSFGYKKVPEFLQPENYLKTAEQTTEQNYNMIDGQINNTPTVAELEAKVKTGETISLVDLAETVKADKERGKAAKTEKKPSIRAQLKAAKEQTPKKQAKQKTQDLERS